MHEKFRVSNVHCAKQHGEAAAALATNISPAGTNEKLLFELKIHTNPLPNMQ